MPSPYDPQRVADTKAWFQKAANDLRARLPEEVQANGSQGGSLQGNERPS